MVSNVNIGKAFETEFDFEAKVSGVLVIPQYVASKYVASKNAKGGRLVTTGGAFPDRVCALQSQMFVLDLKSTKNKSKVDIGAGINARTRQRKYNQFDKLKMVREYGVFAFYLVEWRAHDDIAIYPVNESSRWSFVCKYDDGIHVGHGNGWARKLCAEVYKFYKGMWKDVS